MELIHEGLSHESTPDSPQSVMSQVCIVQWTKPVEVRLSSEQEQAGYGAGEESVETANQMMRVRGITSIQFPLDVVRNMSLPEPLPLTEAEQRKALEHKVPRLPWELPRAVPVLAAQSEPQSSYGELQPRVLAASKPPSINLSAIVNQMDPSLVSQLQAMASSSTGTPALPLGIDGGSRRSPRGNGSFRATGWDVGGAQPMSHVPARIFPEDRPNWGGWGGNEDSDISSSRASQGPFGALERAWQTPPGFSGSQPHDYGHGGNSWRDTLGTPDHTGSSRFDIPGPPGLPFGGGPAPLQGMQSSGKPCLFYNSSQGCRNGDKCRFSHISTGLEQSQLNAALTAISRRPPPSREYQRDPYGPPLTRRRIE